MEFTLFTDGACRPNPGKGGWAFIVYPTTHPEKRIARSGYAEQATNNRMEITAVLEGLKHIINISKNSGVCPQVILYADSKYILQAIESWMKSWSKKNWTRKDNKPVSNVDLWKPICGFLYDDKSVSVVSCIHIKGHSGHPENEECDQLAVAEIINK